MKSQGTQQGLTKTGLAQCLDCSSPSEPCSLVCLPPSLFSPITSAGSILDCAWRLMSWLSTSTLCPQKLYHLFCLHFLHSGSDWKLLSLLLLFCWVSLYLFVPPHSPPWVCLPNYLPALVTLCWKANMKSSNFLPFFYCCFCKGSSNKQTSPHPPTSGAFQET